MEPPATILIVDDNDQNLVLMETILRRQGYSSLVARNGEDALRQVAAAPPDLIILDIMMPGIDGFEVCRRLKDDEKTRLIPIVIMTALDQRAEKIRGIEAGADDFLTKPVNQTELMARVRTTLKLKHTVDRKVATLTSINECLSRFVPPAVRRLVAEHPEAPHLDKEERDVSVLFVDVSGYTRLSLTLGKERVDALVQLYFSRFLDCVTEEKGEIIATAGDGMMVLFQDEDRRTQARQGARAALRILRATEGLNHTQDSHEPIHVHMGLNSGPAIVGSSRFEGARGSLWTFTAQGPVTNLAARLGAAAVGDTVLVGPETGSRIDEAFVLEPLGPRAFKGVEVTQHYRLVEERSGVTMPGPDRPSP